MIHKRLKPALGLAGLLALAGLGGCAGRDALPPTVGDGQGSEFGNYAAVADGEMTGPDGERCFVYNWDRPINRTQALRLRSASCVSRERPGWMICRELARTVIPLDRSTLKSGRDDVDRPAEQP